jgi:uncharacterized protein with HEPN domain
MKDDRLYLIHIRECVGRIAKYIKGGQAKFMKSTLIQDAVLRNLQTFSESTQRYLKTSNPSIPQSIGAALQHFETS